MCKRTVISTILGAIAGILCILAGTYLGGVQHTFLTAFGALYNRVLIGFFIGIAAFKINYLIRGAIIGTILGVNWAVTLKPENYIGFMVFSLIYGLLIDFLTTKVFKAPVED